MKHVVPVKEDLSDLIEKYEYLESHPEIYDNIASNAKDFVGNVFSADNILNYTKDIIQKYGLA